MARASRVTCAMNFGGDGERGDIVILSGTAHVDESGPNAVEDAAFVVKYATEFERFGMTAESYANRFSVPLRIRLTAVDGR